MIYGRASAQGCALVRWWRILKVKISQAPAAVFLRLKPILTQWYTITS